MEMNLMATILFLWLPAIVGAVAGYLALELMAGLLAGRPARPSALRRSQDAKEVKR